jgi:hypothetical protein
MNVLTGALFSLSICIGAIIGWIRFKKIDPAFFPFIFLIWIGVGNEVISLILMYHGYPNVVNFNLFALTEALFISWQFFRWNLFKHKWVLFILQLAFISFFLIESFSRGLFSFNSYFIIIHSFLIVLMSISMVNKNIFQDNSALLRNPVFLICMGFIIYFTYTVLVEAFWIFGLHRKLFRLAIHEILVYINLFTNLLFAFSILWMPMKQQYIMQS